MMNGVLTHGLFCMSEQSLVEGVQRRVQEVYAACGRRHHELEEQRTAAAAAAAAAEAKHGPRHGRSRSLQSNTSITSACDVQVVVSPTVRHSMVRTIYSHHRCCHNINGICR